MRAHERSDASVEDQFLIPAWIDGVLRPVDKLTVHYHGLRHPAVSVFVTRGQHILLQKRAAGKYHTPGMWANTCCTHPRWGENPAACAERRLLEEMGIAGLRLKELGEIEYRTDVGNGMTEHEDATVFVAEAPEGLEPAPDLAEVADTAWITRTELEAALRDQPERFTPWLRIYMAQHHAMIFASTA